jgi:hypothetical protein
MVDIGRYIWEGHRKYIVIILVLIVLSAVAFMILGRCVPAERAQYMSVIEELREGSISPDAEGMVPLPTKYRGLVVRDAIYAGRLRDGRLVVLFPTWYGRGADLEGYVYVAGGLNASDFYTVLWSGRPVEFIDVGSRRLLSVDCQRGDWAWISRRLD